MIINKICLLFSDLPDKVIEADLRAKGWQVYQFNDLAQINAYNEAVKNQILNSLESIGGDMPIEKKDEKVLDKKVKA